LITVEVKEQRCSQIVDFKVNLECLNL